MEVSCIILCTFNDGFVAQRLVPSLLRNSDTSTTEIIVVDNGPAQNLVLDGVKVIRSEPHHIPRGYNAGVAEARGRYIALFHDDCIMNDPRWIEKSIAALNADVVAVGPDLRLKSCYAYLKETPLVMEKEKFLALGGYDESHFIGYQADLLCIAIENAGKQIQCVNIDCTHFAIPGKSIGMSTVLLLAGPREREQLRQAFAEPDFGLQDMERVLDEAHTMTRAHYFINTFIQIPASIYMQKEYGVDAQEQPLPLEQLIRDGVLHRLTPKTREEMDKVIGMIDYYNELIDRSDDIRAGRR